MEEMHWCSVFLIDRARGKRRGEEQGWFLRLYETMGYDALNIGDTDLGLGVEYLKTLQKKSKIPFLSANLKEKKTGRPIFKSHLVKEVDGMKIGIIGLLTPEIHPFIQKQLKSYFIEDPTKAALETINRLPGRLRPYHRSCPSHPHRD